MAYIGSKPADKALTGADIEDGTIQIADLSATGTASASTFLRGDGSWVAAGGSNTPAFSVTRTSSQTLSSSTTTKIQGNVELLDTDNCYDNSTNYRFTPTTAGFYQFNLLCHPSRTNSNTVGGLTIYIYKNGSPALLNSFGVDTAVENVFGYSISGVLEANGSTDYFEAYINYFVTSGTPSIGTSDGTVVFNFSGFKIIE